MPFRPTIALRIFGLAVFLLVLTITLAGFLVWQVTALEQEFQVVATRDLPLQSGVARLHEAGLRRRLSFERWVSALNAAEPDDQATAAAAANYARFTDELGTSLTEARAPLSRFGAKDREHLLGISELLTQIEAAYPLITARQKEVLALKEQNEDERANAMIASLTDLQRLVQTQRDELQSRTFAMVQASSDDVASLVRRVKSLAVAATICIVLLGLAVAALVSDRLVRPVRSLISAMRAVQGGRLDLELPVQTRDEVGELTTAFNFFVHELRSKEVLTQTFGKYLDPRILARLLAPEAAEAGGGRQIMTVAFADIVGFTGLAERLTPSLMVKVLNRHFGLQSQVVQEHLGVVDKFIGDAVMAFWGPPFTGAAEHATLACRATLGQLAAIEMLSAELPELTGLRRDTPVIDLCHGLATGEVIVGSIGSENTRTYTVIGDTVNLAARLEALNRTYGSRTLLSEATVREAGAAFATREIDAITVKGKTEPVRIYELLGFAESLDPARRAAAASYARGLAAYRAADWSTAADAFAETIRLWPTDRPAQVFLERVAILRARPSDAPPWDGIWRFAAK